MRYGILYPNGGVLTPVIDDTILRHVVYELAAQGDVELDDPDEALERIFEVYNSDERPHPIRSLSVGDVVRLEDAGDWICLIHGWSPALVEHTLTGWSVELLAPELS